MSRTRSTAMNRPMPSIGRPIAFKMAMIATKEAEGTPATPMEVMSASKTTIN